MIFHQITAGGDRNFAYLAGDRNHGKGALFDPPPEKSLYMPLVEEHGLEVLYVVATHGHGDHAWGLNAAKRALGCKVVAHRSSHLRADIPVEDGDRLPLGSTALEIIHTPGHTDDSICILVSDKLVTGDTLFVGKVGGTDYGEGARKEWESLRNKVLSLDDSIEVYPGHDYGLAPVSTIGAERKKNPFLLCSGFEEFLDLKKNWLQYKKEHGIP